MYSAKDRRKAVERAGSAVETGAVLAVAFVSFRAAYRWKTVRWRGDTILPPIILAQGKRPAPSGQADPHQHFGVQVLGRALW